MKAGLRSLIVPLSIHRRSGPFLSGYEVEENDMSAKIIYFSFVLFYSPFPMGTFLR